MNIDWEQRLKKEFDKVYFKNLKKKIDYFYETETVFPDKSKIFNSFELCSFSKLKVVIIGQDPYPTIGHANGLCFL